MAGAAAAQRQAAEPAWRQWAEAISDWTVRSAAQAWRHDWAARARGGVVAGVGACLIPAFATYHADDPSWNASSSEAPVNLLGGVGAIVADVGLQSLGLGAWMAALLMLALGLQRLADPQPSAARRRLRGRALAGALGLLLLSAVLAAPAPPALWPLAEGLGGLWGERLLTGTTALLELAARPQARIIAAVVFGLAALPLLAMAVGLGPQDLKAGFSRLAVRRARNDDEGEIAAEDDAEPASTPIKRARPAAKRTPAPVEIDDEAEDDAPLPFVPDAPTTRKLDVKLPEGPQAVRPRRARGSEDARLRASRRASACPNSPC
jgi:S-DNA-T family DNA segregation ATPase FtsK/SpoIIIE